ncbi:hypothetical protein Pcinc_013637 [Petrolisthes cinctipes]|uniref:Uncharacterized protein n=1 Tax=Petrolisthes cinctipes TaxID=88211 RepID=A0AAE1FZG6_PETCI|nr:hypothetical protein Pcinc_013637 [Petrolisthes cinctipes]
MYHSSDSLDSCHSYTDRSPPHISQMGNGNSLSFCDIASGQHNKSPLASPNIISSDMDRVFRYELHSVHLSSNGDDNNDVKSGADPMSHKTNTEDTEVLEGLPAGPPPKKPPRTFAYDIYKNTKPSKQASQSQKTSVDVKNKSTESDPCSPPPPIYAVPVKKKSRCNNNNNNHCNNSFSPKPPIRSKSDLSKQDVVSPKPSVAPKPPHVLAKAKRASLVDPIISSYDNNNKEQGEEEEEAAMTSEFQRQAHVRYSLRRPKKPAPTPPTTTTTFTSNHSEDSSSGVNINDTRGTTNTPSSLNNNNSRRRNSLNIHNNNTEPTSNNSERDQMNSNTKLSSPSSSCSSSSYTNNNNNNNTNTRDYENVHYRNSNNNNNKSPKDKDNKKKEKEEEDEKKTTQKINMRPHSNSYHYYQLFPPQTTTTTTTPDYEDVLLSAPTPVRSSSFSAQNLQTPTPPPPPPISPPLSFLESNQPMSLGGYSSVGTSMTPAGGGAAAVDTMGLSSKRSMSDETLYKGYLQEEGDVVVL